MDSYMRIYVLLNSLSIMSIYAYTMAESEGMHYYSKWAGLEREKSRCDVPRLICTETHGAGGGK